MSHREDPRIDAVVLGASGYVGAELLRLLAGHPGLRVAAAVSRSAAGVPLSTAFPALAACGLDAAFIAPEALPAAIEGSGPLALFSALPHGEAAGAIDAIVGTLAEQGREVRVVDCSADFRLAPELFEEVYGAPHGAPELAERFVCALPDVTRTTDADFVAHPGCFTTAVVLAARPLVAAGLVGPRITASCVTGSTGSGRVPSATTHHPDRHGDLRAYKPLAHRHAHEMASLLGPDARVSFVPHSGPFARGIHATLVCELRSPLAAEDVAASMRAFYEGSPFVSVATEPPRLRHVVGTNQARLGVAVAGRDLVVTSVIDNLTKGAAGGAVQWMNRLLGRDETEGLRLPGLGWC